MLFAKYGFTVYASTSSKIASPELAPVDNVTLCPVANERPVVVPAVVVIAAPPTVSDNEKWLPSIVLI
jgi:hypothetical protein